MSSDLRARILVAIPAAVFAIFIVVSGGEVFAGGLVLLGVVALHELYSLMRRARPIDLAGYIAIVAIIAARALRAAGRRADRVRGLVPAGVPAGTHAHPAAATSHGGSPRRSSGFVYLGLPLAHAIFLRELPHGDGLLIDVLVATFIGDTGAYLVGRTWGRHKLAPDISPNKTVEGLMGGILCATIAFWCAGLYQDWLSGPDALLIGFLVAITAPVGDLFESVIKRDLEVKDTGRFFGVHGGVLDRLDAVLFTVVVGYYASVTLGYT